MIRVPGDKSISHRALLLSALASGVSELEGLLPGEDCRSTAGILRVLGCEVPELPSDGGPIRIQGLGLRGLSAPEGVLDCGNSGTTARLLLGLLSGLSIPAVLDGDPSLRSRPMGRVTDPLRAAGGRFTELGAPGRLPLRVVEARIGALRYTSPVASAQVKSALLLAGLGAGRRVEVTEPAPSRDHSERMLRRMGVRVEGEGEGPHRIVMSEPPSNLKALSLRVPGDISSAAFLLVLGALGPRGLSIANVGLNPTRTGVLAVLERMGARIRAENTREMDDPGGEPAGDLVVLPGPLNAVRIGGSEIPSLIDEIPILAVAATRARGTTEIRDAEELRVKESDRISAMVQNLEAVGARVEELPDGLRIEGSNRALEGKVRSFGDHRIAMAFGILGALPGNRIQVDDRGIVDVSFPGFWELLEAQGSFSGQGSRSSEGTPPRASAPEARRDDTEGPDRQAAMGRAPIVTLDGPAGSGKSSTAREVARRLGFLHLDSGALYRAATLTLLRSGLPAEEWPDRGSGELDGAKLELVPEEGELVVRLNGEIQGEELRSPEVTERVAEVAAIPHVRERILGPLREGAREGGVVADGRDMGTVVLPHADLKVYLTASLAERARRRLLQEGVELDAARLEEESRRLAARDDADRRREVAPLRRPQDAVELDTTGLTFDRQVEAIIQAVRSLDRSQEPPVT